MKHCAWAEMATFKMLLEAIVRLRKQSEMGRWPLVSFLFLFVLVAVNQQDANALDANALDAKLPEGCRIAELQQAANSSTELQAAMAGLMSGLTSGSDDLDLSSLFSLGHLLPAACAPLFSPPRSGDDGSGVRPTGSSINKPSLPVAECYSQATIATWCMRPTMAGTRKIIGCIPRKHFCPIMLEIVDQVAINCDEDAQSYLSEVAKALVRHQCPFPTQYFDLEMLSVLPYEYLKHTVARLTKEQLVGLLSAVTSQNVGGLMSTVDCRIWNDLAANAYMRGVGADSFKNLALFPILPEMGCDQLKAEMLMPVLQMLAIIPFDCRSNAQAQKDREQAERRNAPPRGQQMHGPPRCQFTCGRIIMKKLLSSNMWSTDNLAMIPNLHGCMDKAAVKKVAKENSCALFSKDMIALLNRKDRRKMARACMENAKPEDFTVETVRRIGCALGVLPLGVLEDIPGGVMCQVIDELTPCIDRRTKNDVKLFYSNEVVRCIGNEDMTTDKAKKMGLLVARAGAKKLRKLAKDTVKAIAGQIRESLDDLKGPASKLARRMIASIFAQKLDLSEMSNNIDFMNTVEIDRMKTATDEASLKSLLGMTDNETVVPDMGDSLNRFSFDVLKNSRSEAFTPNDFWGWGSILKGLSSSDIDNLDSNKSLEFALQLAMGKPVSGKQVDAITKLLIKGLRAHNSSHHLGALPDDELSQIAGWVLQNIEDSDIVSELSSEKCKLICRKIASSPNLKCGNHPKQRQRLLHACLTCMEIGASASSDDIRTVGALLQEDDGTLLQLVSSAKSDDMGEALLNAVPARRLACMSKEARQKFTSKLKAVFGDDAEKRTDLGGWWLELVSENATNIDSIEPAVEELHDDEETACCRREKTTEENREVDEERSVIYDKVATIVQNNAEATDVFWRRRKRMTTSLTCTDVYMLGPAVESLGVDKLLAMNDVEFYGCVSRLGEYVGWTASQYSDLLGRAIHIEGDICAAESTKLQEFGTLAYGLTVDNIACLLNLDDDAMIMLGSLPNFSQAQLDALIARYMGLKGIDARALSADNLNTIGHALCGLTEEQILSIPVAVYISSSSMIGALQNCGAMQLNALASLAEHADAHGPAKDWTPAITSSVGIVLAGVSGEKMKNYGSDVIEAISKDAIKHLPKLQLQMLTAEQLKLFSREQAMSATDDQKSALSLEQQNALLQARDGSDAELITVTTTAKPSAAAGVYVSTNLCLLTITFAFLSQAIARHL